jgi:hypothetical protein
MDALEVLLAILIWLLVLGFALMRTPGGSVRSLILPWLVLSILTMAVEFIVLFIFSYGLLFFVSEQAAAIGVIVSAIILGATPVVWALILRRRAHAAHRTAQGSARG